MKEPPRHEENFLRHRQDLTQGRTNILQESQTFPDVTRLAEINKVDLFKDRRIGDRDSIALGESSEERKTLIFEERRFPRGIKKDIGIDETTLRRFNHDGRILLRS